MVSVSSSYFLGKTHEPVIKSMVWISTSSSPDTAKASVPIKRRVSGNDSAFRFQQSEAAESPIAYIPSDILTSERLVHTRKRT